MFLGSPFLCPRLRRSFRLSFLSLSLQFAPLSPFVLVLLPPFTAPLYVMAPGRRHSGRYFLASSCTARDKLALRKRWVPPSEFARRKIRLPVGPLSIRRLLRERPRNREECRLAGLFVAQTCKLLEPRLEFYDATLTHTEGERVEKSKVQSTIVQLH